MSEFGDYGPPEAPKEGKTSRKCNYCGQQLNENSPNWFQCSESCRAAQWKRCHPPKSCGADDYQSE